MPWVERPLILQSFLDLFGALTGVPLWFFAEIGEAHEGLRSSQDAVPNPYCRSVRQIPELEEICAHEHGQRALTRPGVQDLEVVTCHAGLQNCVLRAEGPAQERIAIVLAEYRSTDAEHMALSQKNHKRLLDKVTQTDGEMQGALRKEFALLGMVRKLDSALVGQYLGACRQVAPILCQTLLREDAYLRQAVQDISHEIQTRIQAVLTETELLIMEPDWASWTDLRNRLGGILSRIMATATVVHSLEDYLGEAPTTRYSMRKLVDEAVSIYAAEAERKSILIRTYIADSAPAHRDPRIMVRHMQYAVNNLLQNAIKYSFTSVRPAERGSIPRVVSVRGTYGDDSYVLSFQNYGVGITQDEIEQGSIFRPDYQGELTHGEFRQGAGRGLSLVKRVVEAHGGFIEVTSRKMSESKGALREPHLTTFVVTIPYEGRR